MSAPAPAALPGAAAVPHDPPPTSDPATGEGPLAPLRGARPPAPTWFTAALAAPVERGAVTVAGAAIETRAWGPRGAPGLLLLHGNGAHADWWSFLAPLLAEDRRVAALSWSGMGGSDWRPAYSIDLFVEEALAAADWAGLWDGPTAPIVLGHSFGGFPALALAHAHGGRLGGVISADSPIPPPGRDFGGPPVRSRPNRVYDSVEAALARFRLAPPQPCETLYALDHIARGALRPAPGGVTWAFDPFLWRSFGFDSGAPLLAAPQCPVAVLWGAESALMTPEVVAHMRTLAPAGTPFIALPDARHHLMLDQPLAFVAALRTLFATWPARG